MSLSYPAWPKVHRLIPVGCKLIILIPEEDWDHLRIPHDDCQVPPTFPLFEAQERAHSEERIEGADLLLLRLHLWHRSAGG